MSSRFVTPGFATRSRRTAPAPVSESVTARDTLAYDVRQVEQVDHPGPSAPALGGGAAEVHDPA